MKLDFHSKVFGYCAAAAFTLAGVGLVVTTPMLRLTPFLPFLALTAITARLWGYGPTILSLVISAISVDYFLFPPVNHLSFAQNDLIRITAFSAVSLVIAGIARERTRAEERMRASLERLQRAQEIGKVASWELELATGKIRWSENAPKVFRGSKLTADVEEFALRLHVEDRAQVVEALAKVAAEPLDLEYRVLDDAGMPRWYHTRSRPVMPAEGDSTKLVAGATADITETKESAKALLNAEKLAAAGRLSATIAHEINNPLEAVMNLVYLAKGDPNISDTSRQMLRQAEAELGRTAHIARQNLGFYRDRTEPVFVDLRELLMELIAIYSSHARRKNIRIDLDGDNLRMTLRAGDARQAISNVMLNAIDATPSGGEVKVQLKAIPEGACITIKDSGQGVARELHEKIFEPFFTTKKDYGTGLGLWVTRQLLIAHGGDVRLTENGPGAEFELTFRNHALERSA